MVASIIAMVCIGMVCIAMVCAGKSMIA